MVIRPMMVGYSIGTGRSVANHGGVGGSAVSFAVQATRFKINDTFHVTATAGSAKQTYKMLGSVELVTSENTANRPENR